MTPQLQQAIKLLQYTHQEMVGALELELKENPVLETAADDDPFTDGETPERNDLDSLEDSTKEVDNPREDLFDPDWSSYLETYGGDRSSGPGDFSDGPMLENLAKASDNLFRYLLRQLQLSRIEGTDRRIALQIIGNIDDNGYLDLDLDQLAESISVKREQVDRVLSLVQEFDPTGVAARDLGECLIIQARELDPPEPTVLRVLEEAFDFFREGKFDKVARSLKIPLPQVEKAVRTISRLEPKPGRPFQDSSVRYVVPDIFVFKTGDDYSIVLNDDGLPKLKISPLYHKHLHADGAGNAAKDYIQEKMRGAMWLMKSIHQRQRTIYKVTRSIVKFQRDFFDKGIDYLVPLVLKDVAMDVDMHESTISRVTSNKYVHTPRGIFELKYFFNSGIRHGADTIASESVKNLIARIVKNEDPKKPASDKRIVEELARQDIRIARRTVTKYRELLGIPPSNKRRKRF
jgi:RNA polymerase sigma-54 factor